MKRCLKGVIKSEMIENYIKENKFTIKEFCEQCKIGYPTYRRIVTGKNFIITALFKIAKVMNVKICKFFNG